MMKFSDRQLLLCVQVCFLEEILEFHGRLGGWSMSIARWPMADILVQRLKLELRVLDDRYAAADYFWIGSLLSRLDRGHYQFIVGMRCILGSCAALFSRGTILGNY